MNIEENPIFIRVCNSFPGFTTEQKLLLTAVIQQEILWNYLSNSSDIQKDRIDAIDTYNYVKDKINKDE